MFGKGSLGISYMGFLLRLQTDVSWACSHLKPQLSWVPKRAHSRGWQFICLPAGSSTRLSTEAPTWPLQHGGLRAVVLCKGCLASPEQASQGNQAEAAWTFMIYSWKQCQVPSAISVGQSCHKCTQGDPVNGRTFLKE